MEIGHPFRAITPTLDGEVLQVLVHVESSMTPGRLHQHLSGRSEAGIRKCLDRLARQGIVSVTPAGNAFLYGLNRQHLLATQVVEIANVRRTFLDRLRVELGSWEAPPFFAALFGSANRSGRDLKRRARWCWSTQGTFELAARDLHLRMFDLGS
jgi:hypothetical protein